MVIIFVIWIKIGPEARTLLKVGLLGGGDGIFLGMKSSGAVILRSVKSKGTTLIHGKKGFVFLPSVIPNPTEDLPDIPETPLSEGASDEDRGIVAAARRLLNPRSKLKAKVKVGLNDLIQRKAWFAGKPLFVGSIVATLGSTPFLNEAIALAQNEDGGDSTVANFLKKLVKYFPDGKIKEFNLVVPWEIDALTEYVNISFTDQDINEAYQEGYLKGLSSYEKMNKILMIIAFVCLAGLILTVFWLGK